MKFLYVLYDGSCGLCWRAVKRLSREPTYIPLRFEPAGSSFALGRFADVLAGGDVDQVVVVADTGEVYRGTSAWIMVLFAMRRYRPLAMRLATPRWRPVAGRAIAVIGRYRHWCSEFFMLNPEPQVLAEIAADVRARPSANNATCVGGACERPSEITPLDRLMDARRQVRAEWRAHELGMPPIPPKASS